VINGFAAPYESMQHQSDRFMCKLKDYSLNGLEIIRDSGTVLSYGKLKDYSSYRRHGLPNFYSIPLRPSCHRGLLMTIAPKEPAPLHDRKYPPAHGA
jgi:tyrosyl-DNA phosphodiesterase 2